MTQDLKFAFRTLRKKKGFTTTIIAILALGIGFNSAIFSVVYEVLLKSLPYRDPDRLVALYQRSPKLFGNEILPNSFPAVKDWQTQDGVFENAGGFLCVPGDIIADGVPERVSVGMYTQGVFSTLGVSPILGRLLTEEESIPRGASFALVSYEYWQSRFGARQDVLGNRITVGNSPYTIVGVLPRNFKAFELVGGFRSAAIWIPVSAPEKYLHRGNTFLVGVARLKSSVSLQTAQASLAILDKANAEQYPGYCAGRNTIVEKMHDSITGQLSKTLMILLGAVGFVLMIACANVANLLLARAAEREREMAIRISVGAGKGRLVRLLLTESLLLSLSGGVAGLLVASVSLDLINALISPDLGIPEIHLEVHVVAYLFAMATLTGLIFGLIPALEALKVDFNAALKGAGRGMSATPFRQKLKGMLIMFEMGISLTLLIGAGLLIRNFIQIWKTDPGFRPDRVLTMEITRLGDWFDFGRLSFYQPLLDRVANLPSVTASGLASNVPGQSSKSCSFLIEGRPTPREDSQTPTEMLINVTPQYFKALGIPLKRGRPFSEQDNANAPKVALISDGLAKKHWGDQDPLGTRIFYEGSWVTIVGIVGNIRQKGLIEKAEPIVYVPYFQYPIAPVSLIIRSQADPSLLISVIRQEVRNLDRTQVVANVSTLNRVLLSTMAPQQLVMYMIGTFAVLALLLAVSGIYGVISYYAAMHTQEAGIRMALGGDPSDILKLVIGKGLILILTGTGLGVLASLAMTRLLSSLLQEVSPTDPLTFSSVTSLLIVAALSACYIPARRISRVNPMVALRCE